MLKDGKTLVLGLDIGVASLGFALIEVFDNEAIPTFNIVGANSVIFDDPKAMGQSTAEDRRVFRSSRRVHERARRRKTTARRLLYKYGVAPKEIIDSPQEYFDYLGKMFKEPYSILERAISGESLNKEEFVYVFHSLVSHRGALYGDGEGKSAVAMVLEQARKASDWENPNYRNKHGNFVVGFTRKNVEHDLMRLLDSQTHGWGEPTKYQDFVDKVLHGVNDYSRGLFEDRPTQSFEPMVGYCSFYHAYHPNRQKRCFGNHASAIEWWLLQKLQNMRGNIVNKKTGEVFNFTPEEERDIVKFWLNTPNADKITNTRLLATLGHKNLKLHTKEGDDGLDISIHRQLLSIKPLSEWLSSGKYKETLVTLYYYASTHQAYKEERLQWLWDEETAHKLSLVETSGRDYKAFSLKFIEELLPDMRAGMTHHEALTKHGFFNRGVGLEPVLKLPPLRPDDKLLQELDGEKLFPANKVSPGTERAISAVRLVVNSILKRYGRPDRIIIETANELNNNKAKEKIRKAQRDFKDKSERAETALKEAGIEASPKNLRRTKLWMEQKECCIYSGERLSLHEALDGAICEVDHFIPRSRVFFGDSRNTVLVKKEQNQNKGNTNPLVFLPWEAFKDRVNHSDMSGRKKAWLTNTDGINEFFDEKSPWENRYLNDTRGASKIIGNYLEYYLYPKKEAHGKGENKRIFRVNAMALSRLKTLWGVDKAQPQDDDGKKDRGTNYHHTIDALMIALCNPSIIHRLHAHVLSGKGIESCKPQNQRGEPIDSVVHQMVEEYKNNKSYVYHKTKRKYNKRGFQDTNLKVFLDKKDGRFYEIATHEISPALLLDNFGRPLKPHEVEAVFENVLSVVEDGKIKEAIIDYKQRLLFGDGTQEPCFFINRHGKKQVVRRVKYRGKNIGTAAIILHERGSEKRAMPLTVENWKKVQGKPFLVKRNDKIVSVDLHDTPEGQIVGLNYFSTATTPSTKEFSKVKMAFHLDKNKFERFYRGDFVVVKQKGREEITKCNGGGTTSGGSNAINVVPLNTKAGRKAITLGTTTTVHKVNMNVFGEVYVPKPSQS